MQIVQTLIQSRCNFSDLHTIRMHFFRHSYNPGAKFLTSYNPDANVSDLHIILYATCRDYRLDSCILASHRTMSCRMMKLRPASGSVHPPPHENCGAFQALCTPIVKSPTALGSGHFLCTPLAKIGGRLRLCAPP